AAVNHGRRVWLSRAKRTLRGYRLDNAIYPKGPRLFRCKTQGNCTCRKPLSRVAFSPKIGLMGPLGPGLGEIDRMSDPVTIGAVVVSVMVMAAEAVVRSGVGEAVKD